MLLSFSEPEMLPYVRAGLRQLNGEVSGDRVKRQTIRKLGQRGEKLLAWDPLSHTIPYDMQLWWKSRRPERELLGVVPCRYMRVYKIEILHSFSQEPNGPKRPLVRINGPRGWRDGNWLLWWSPGDDPGGAIGYEARRDGFDSVEQFRDYFVPHMGDRFDAIIFKW